MEKFSATAIIPIYNEENNIDEIIYYAENQTISFNKIIIINDGSNDKSYSKILKYKKKK